MGAAEVPPSPGGCWSPFPNIKSVVENKKYLPLALVLQPCHMQGGVLMFDIHSTPPVTSPVFLPLPSAGGEGAEL